VLLKLWRYLGGRVGVLSLGCVVNEAVISFGVGVVAGSALGWRAEK
jgi:hypothetical protein